MATSYTVSDTARLLGVSVATVRRIADEMAEILPDYQHIPGKARRLSEEDVKTISALWTRLQADTTLTRSALLAELSAPGSEPLIIPDSLPTPEPDTPQNAPESQKDDRDISESLALSDNALATFLQAQSNTQRQIEKLSAQLSEIRQAEPQAERRYPVAVILSFAVLVVGVTTSALFTDSRFGLACSVLALLILSSALIWPTLRR